MGIARSKRRSPTPYCSTAACRARPPSSRNIQAGYSAPTCPGRRRLPAHNAASSKRSPNRAGVFAERSKPTVAWVGANERQQLRYRPRRHHHIVVRETNIWAAQRLQQSKPAQAECPFFIVQVVIRATYAPVGGQPQDRLHLHTVDDGRGCGINYVYANTLLVLQQKRGKRHREGRFADCEYACFE